MFRSGKDESEKGFIVIEDEKMIAVFLFYGILARKRIRMMR